MFEQLNYFVLCIIRAIECSFVCGECRNARGQKKASDSPILHATQHTHTLNHTHTQSTQGDTRKIRNKHRWMPLSFLHSLLAILFFPFLSLLLLQVSLHTHDSLDGSAHPHDARMRDRKSARSHHFPPTARSLCNAPVSVGCLRVLSCFVSFCVPATDPSPRRDSWGFICCEQCLGHMRFNTYKGKKHKHGAGHICQDCYDEQRGKRKAASTSSSSPSSSDGVAPPPKKKRRTASDPGTQSDSDTAITTRATASSCTQGRLLRSSLLSLPFSYGSPTQPLHEWDVSALLLSLHSC